MVAGGCNGASVEMGSGSTINASNVGGARAFAATHALRRPAFKTVRLLAVRHVIHLNLCVL